MAKFEELKGKILEAQAAYYNGNPIMTDAEFDSLWDQALELNPNDEIFTEKVGEDHIDGFEKAKHLILMGSQSKANTTAQMEDWLAKIKAPIIGQYKMDGISLELNFKNGEMVQAITRGNGEIGDDITKNVKKMNVPKSIDKSFTGAVRGEILLSRDNKKKYFPEAKNCRNMASGLSKRLDGDGCQYLDVVCYDAQYLNGTSFETQENLQSWLKKNGFVVAEWKVFNTPAPDGCMNYMKEIFGKFDDLQYDIDGIVWKQNVIDMDDLKTNLRPKTQIALKPAKVEKVTKLIGIEWNLHNGLYTPIALLEPIELQGSTVQRASLTNVRNIELLGLEIGHMVSVIKANMIIPKIIKDIDTGKSLDAYYED